MYKNIQYIHWCHSLSESFFYRALSASNASLYSAAFVHFLCIVQPLSSKALLYRYASLSCLNKSNTGIVFLFFVPMPFLVFGNFYK